MAQGHVSLVCNFALESVIHPNITGIAMKSSRQTPPMLTPVNILYFETKCLQHRTLYHRHCT